MANRKFEMHEYRQIIVRLRLGVSIRRDGWGQTPLISAFNKNQSSLINGV